MSDNEDEAEVQMAKKKSGIPTGNAGEYFVMGELLRRGFDAHLADRNTKEYDLLVGRAEDEALRKVQVKSVRTSSWYVNPRDFGPDGRVHPSHRLLVRVRQLSTGDCSGGLVLHSCLEEGCQFDRPRSGCRA
jgi:hypothetical protein